MTQSKSARVRPKVVAATVTTLLCGPLAAQTLVAIPRLPGDTFIYLSGISDDGTVVTGDSGNSVSNLYHAVRWTQPTGTQSLGQAAGHSYSSGHAVSGDGLTVVGVSGATYDIASRWTAATGMVSLGSLTPGQPSFAFGVSQSGSVIVGDGYFTGGVQRAWKWTSAGGMQPFATLAPGTVHSLALRVNNAGTHTVGYCYNNAPALVWPVSCMWLPSGDIVTMGQLAGTVMSVPSDLTADGSVVFGYCADADSTVLLPFKWSGATGVIEALPLPSGFARGVAGSCTTDGSIVTGYAVDDAGNGTACIWQSGQPPRTLAEYLAARGTSTVGWTFSSATVSAGGSAIAGSGTFQGLSTGWYMYLGVDCAASPVINSQPAPVTVTDGGTAVFSVAAGGGGLSYQWIKDVSTNVDGAVGPTLTLDAVTPATAGTYSCIVTNACGTTRSAGATLTVTTSCPAPTVVMQPVDTQACVGGAATLRFDAVGGDPVEFQWVRNGQDIHEAAGRLPILVLSQVSIADAGEYVCIAHNDCGDTVSVPVHLYVDPADVGRQGGVAGRDGLYDNNDFIVFVDLFFNQSPIADRGRQGGTLGADSHFDNNDFVVFVDQFFSGAGC